MSETELIDIFDSDMNHVGVADKETAHSGGDALADVIGWNSMIPDNPTQGAAPAGGDAPAGVIGWNSMMPDNLTQGAAPAGGDAPAGVIGWNSMMPDNLTQGAAPRRPTQRAEALRHKTFHCWIIGSDGRVLLQRRSESKKMFKRLFDVSAAGHYRAGESGVGGAREIEEELGFKPDVTRLAELCVFTDEYVTANYINCEFCYVYAYLSDTPLSGYELSDETDGLATVGLDDLIRLFNGEAGKASADYFDKHSRTVTRIDIETADFVPSTSGYYTAVLQKLKEWFNG